MTPGVIVAGAIAGHPSAMTAYAIGRLREFAPGTGAVEYLERIDATLHPFGGRFLVHGAAPDVREGEWPGATVVIAFCDLEAARGWYESPPYQAIIGLRTRQFACDVALIDGCEAGHRGADLIPQL